MKKFALSLPFLGKEKAFTESAFRLDRKYLKALPMNCEVQRWSFRSGNVSGAFSLS
jgi:hypothetical protein